MAKRIAAKSMIQIWFGGTEDPAVRIVGYSLDDTVDPDIRYDNQGTPTGTAAPHTLTAPELAGTLSEFITDVVDDIKAAEGIA